MSEFTYDGDQYPMPAGWEGLSADEWFYKMAELKEAIIHASQEDLPAMQDEDGDDLDPEEVKVIQSGFQNGRHYSAFEGWGYQKYATEAGEDVGDYMMKMSAIASEKLQKEAMGAAMESNELLQPVQGVSIEQYGQAQAKIAAGASQDEVLAELGMDAAKWEAVSMEWNTRMATDTTMAVATAYGNAMISGGSGNFAEAGAAVVNEGVAGDMGAEPMPLETYIEIEVAQRAADQNGQDPNDVFTQFGITALDYGTVGMYWAKKMQTEVSKYHELFTKYTAEMEAKYGIADDEDDDEDEDDE